MANTDVRLRYVAEIEDLAAELAKIPGLSAKEAKKAATAMNKEFKKLEKSKAVTEPLSKQLKGIEDSAGDADSALKGVAGAVGLISPPAEKALSALGELGGGIEGLLRTVKVAGASAGPIALLGVAVAALAGTYKLLKDDLEEAEAAQKAAASSAADAQKAYESWKGAMQGIDDIIALAAGEIDKFDLALRKQTEGFTKATAGQSKAIRAGIAQQEKRIAKLKEEEEGLGLNRVALEANIAAQKAAEQRIAKFNEALGAVNAKRERGIEILELNADRERELANATRATTAATVEATDAAEGRRAQAQKELEVEQAKVSASLKLGEITKAALQSQMSERELLIAQYDEEIARVNELAALSGNQEEASKARVALAEKHNAALRELDQKRHQELLEFEAARAAAREAEAEKQIQDAKEVTAAVRDSAVEMLGSLEGSLGAISETMKEEHRAGALALFAASQAAALGQLAISAPVAIGKAQELGQPAGAFAAIGLTAMFAGLAAEVTAASLAFHTGSSRPDEFAARLQKGEFVGTAAARSALGVSDRDIDRANAGVGGGGGSIKTVQLMVGTKTAEMITVSGSGTGEGKRALRKAGQGTRSSHYRSRR